MEEGEREKKKGPPAPASSERRRSRSYPTMGGWRDRGGPQLCNLQERRRIALCNLLLVYKPKERLFLPLIDLQSGPDPVSEKALGKGAGILAPSPVSQVWETQVAGPPGAARTAARWLNNVY